MGHVAVQLFYLKKKRERRQGFLVQPHVSGNPFAKLAKSEHVERWTLAEAIEIYFGLQRAIQEAGLLLHKHNSPLPKNYSIEEFGDPEPPDLGDFGEYSREYEPDTDELAIFFQPPQLDTSD